MKVGDVYEVEPEGVEHAPAGRFLHEVTVMGVETFERDPDLVTVRCECGFKWAFEDLSGGKR